MDKPIEIGIFLDEESSWCRQVMLGIHHVAMGRDWILRIWRDDLRVDPDVRRSDAFVVGSGVLDHVHDAWWLQHKVVGAEVDLSQYGIASVVVDQPAVGTEAAQHMVHRGLRHLAAFGLAGLPFSEERVRAFARAAIGRGATYHSACDNMAAEAAFDPDHPHSFRRWLTHAPRPLGLFCPCDAWARHVSVECRIAGIRVPDDVAILGVDNDEFACELSHPPLSSVSIPWQQMGQRVGGLLSELLEGRHPRELVQRVVPSGVVVRQSSDMLAIEDADVADALSFIRSDFQSLQGVDDVLREIPISRKRLEAGFRRYVGRGIMSEIRRVKIEHAKRLLATTELPASQIAERCGFSSPKKLSELFGAAMGMSPLQYRGRFALQR